MAELLVWPALIAYGEAAVAYAGALGGPRSVRLGIWGVRIGWLAQTALLIAQMLDSDGFPWGTWAGALNLFVWLVVGAYLIWGCTPRYRLLGLGVMPVAAVLLVAAWAGGGTGVAVADDTAGWMLALHVGLMLAGLAGLTLSAGLAGLYLWQERRLKQRDTDVLRLRLPPLDSLDRLSARTAFVSLIVLSTGIVVGLVSFDRGDFDVSMAVTLAIWALYATGLILRRETGLRGRRFAVLLLVGLALVAVVLPLTHFAS